MEKIRDFEVLSSSSTPRMHSGAEVESATLHMPLREDHLLSDHTHDHSWKDRLHHLTQNAGSSVSGLRSDVMSRMARVRRDLSSRASSLKPMAQQGVSSVRSGVQTQWSSIQAQMRSNPSKWAGIAAGAGLGVGILGRILRHRARRQSLPHLLVIESAC